MSLTRNHEKGHKGKRVEQARRPPHAAIMELIPPSPLQADIHPRPSLLAPANMTASGQSEQFMSRFRGSVSLETEILKGALGYRKKLESKRNLGIVGSSGGRQRSCGPGVLRHAICLVLHRARYLRAQFALQWRAKHFSHLPWDSLYAGRLKCTCALCARAFVLCTNRTTNDDTSNPPYSVDTHQPKTEFRHSTNYQCPRQTSNYRNATLRVQGL